MKLKQHNKKLKKKKALTQIQEHTVSKVENFQMKHLEKRQAK